MTAGNGDGLDGAGCTTETGRGVELGSVNTRPIAANSAQAQELIRALAELFPAVFIADGWKPHRPLKLGIHQDLIDRGVLLPDECHAVFRRYCSRLTYQKALASGGSRYALDGELAGEVTPEQMAGGQSRVAAIEARRALKAKAIAAEKQATRQVAKAPKALQPPIAAQFGKPASLADLKAAARKKSAQ